MNVDHSKGLFIPTQVVVQGVKQALGVMRGEDDPRFYPRLRGTWHHSNKINHKLSL
jgi:hypothetical protein